MLNGPFRASFPLSPGTYLLIKMSVCVRLSWRMGHTHPEICFSRNRPLVHNTMLKSHAIKQLKCARTQSICMPYEHFRAPFINNTRLDTTASHPIRSHESGRTGSNNQSTETETVRTAHSRIDRYLTHRCGIPQECSDHPWCVVYHTILVKAKL